MRGESSLIRLRKLKISPFIGTLLIYAVIFIAIGLAVEKYGLDSRPDLRIRLVNYGENLPDSLPDSGQIDFQGPLTGPENIRTFIVLSKTIENPIDLQNPELERISVKADCRIVGDDIATISREYDFKFPGHSQNNPFLLVSAPGIIANDIRLIPFTAYVRYHDCVRVQTYLLDTEGNIKFFNKTRIPLREEVLGCDVVLGRVTSMNLSTDFGLQRCLALGFGYCRTPANFDPSLFDRIDWPYGNNEAMESDLGIVLTPADQPEWAEPWKIFPLPSASVPIYLEPHGWPCLYVFVPGNGKRNGWHTVPDQYESTDPTQVALYKNDDTYMSHYLLNLQFTNNIIIKDRLRIGDEHPVVKEGVDIVYSCMRGVSAHTLKKSTTEIAIVEYANTSDGEPSHLYACFSKADVEDKSQAWNFIPEGGQRIEYPGVIRHWTAFEDSGEHLGFITFDTDGSIRMLRQPAFYSPPVLVGSYKPVDISGDPGGFAGFIGIVPTVDKHDAYVFSTANSGLLLLDENCRALDYRPVSNYFNMNNIPYGVSRPSASQIKARSGQVIMLSSENSDRLYRMVSNEKWIAGWKILKVGIWAALGLIYLLAGRLTWQYYRNRGLFSYGELASTVEKKEMELGIAHGQHSARMRAQLGSVADALAHDLNSPLDSIRKNLELIEKQISIDPFEESKSVLTDENKLREFLEELKEYARSPVFLSLSEINKRADDLEEFLIDHFPDIADRSELFAKNGFGENSTSEFIEKYGADASGKLIRIIDRELSKRRSIKFSLEQVSLSLGIANRLKNLTSKKAFDIRLGVETALQMSQGDIAGKRIRVRQNYGDIPGLRGDPVPLIETINTIVRNAIDVLPEAGEIGIDVSRDENNLVIRIGNNGPQIPKESISKIWDRGFSEGKQGGQGLGLYIAKDLIEQQGGAISVKSEPDWTEFDIRLPLTEAEKYKKPPV